MAASDRVAEIFGDARELHRDALERLAAGDIRDAAEKAWGATMRATDALVLARMGRDPVRTPQTSRELGNLAERDNAALSLVARYYSRQGQLHGDCFYLGICNPAETERRIRETADYIRDAERMAGVGG